MRRRVLQHFANMLCQHFLDLPNGFDLARFVKYGDGAYVFDIWAGICTHSGAQVGRFGTCEDFKQWLARELESHGISEEEIMGCTLRLGVAVSNIEVVESFGRVSRSADFKFVCDSEIATSSKCYTSHKEGGQAWRYDYYWEELYDATDTKTI